MYNGLYNFSFIVCINQGEMHGKLFQRCTHLFYCSVLSLGGNVNTRRMSKPDIGSIFHIKKPMKYSGLTSSDTKRTLMHIFLL